MAAGPQAGSIMRYLFLRQYGAKVVINCETSKTQETPESRFIGRGWDIAPSITRGRTVRIGLGKPREWDELIGLCSLWNGQPKHDGHVEHAGTVMETPSRATIISRTP